MQDDQSLQDLVAHVVQVIDLGDFAGGLQGVVQLDEQPFLWLLQLDTFCGHCFEVGGLDAQPLAELLGYLQIVQVHYCFLSAG
ncbi:hypothetical protein D3C78_1770150 [compost metagenome]